MTTGDTFRRWRVVGAMVVAIVAAALLLVWNADREGHAAVERLAQAQHALAATLSRTLAASLEADPDLDAALAALHLETAQLNAPEEALVLVDRGGGFRDEEGRAPLIPAVDSAARERLESVVIPRAEAAALGLPARRAAVGLAYLSEPAVKLAVVASARRERERALRDEWLPVAAIVFVGVAIAAFGLWALREEHRELKLRHRLEREQLERERDQELARAERIAVASTLSIGIAHELATPLGVITARVEQLRRCAEEAKAARALAGITEQVEQMKHVMQGFLALARGDAPRLTPTSPGELASAAAREVQHRFEHAQIALEVVASALPDVPLDATLMRQALGNLLTNALQASPAGSRVVLRVARHDAEVCFTVEDEGQGISQEVAQRAARPFFTTRASEGGTGLGLAITHEIVRHHGGELSLERRPRGSGTLASITLPAGRAEVRPHG